MYDFLQKNNKNTCIFGQISKNPRKTQGLFENPRKNPRPSEKKPRTQDCFEKPKILGENPSSGNAVCMYVCMYVYIFVCMYVYMYVCIFVCTLFFQSLIHLSTQSHFLT